MTQDADVIPARVLARPGPGGLVSVDPANDRMPCRKPCRKPLTTPAPRTHRKDPTR